MKYLLQKSSIIIFVLLFVTACSEIIPRLSPLNDDDVILAFGDSLTYGTGSNSATESYPAVLQSLTGKTVINAGIPGEISQAGLERLPHILDQTSPKLVILCQGGNDLIRRLGHSQLENNLQQMIQLIQAGGAQVILVAVSALGLTLDVPDLYQNLATEHTIPIEADVIRYVEMKASLKSDQIHPNAQGYRLIAEKIYQLLQASYAL
ncbi:MAG: GDSL-type esterase/lipase family protein [Gammaproteobacteria bacterium]|nr:GDSL-type esterase/lipase family protein [Gammaproteobacteria bacterium]